ncbi:MAG: hypothetical protein E6K80_07690 [Candidatus Eisenbacteria bacterium]|uniref:V-ATPase proteolipid subunit C-like domain-containing protein n=1 Tax=Eiseniibacteriota bacterium TaxID=2212470 RepID=A0A538U474_UNCEI|nr:MAG: hypothetical protein E6K80_07690 [Candidatus Eisenbacteria bacterium]
MGPAGRHRPGGDRLGHRARMIIIAALAEALTIYAFVTMFLLQGKIG